MTYLLERSSRSIPTGEGSRGGMWHDAEFRRLYHRRWRAAHPDYREREALRQARNRATQRGEDPALVTASPAIEPRLPVLVAACSCECGCQAEMVLECGMCRAELHEMTA